MLARWRKIAAGTRPRQIALTLGLGLSACLPPPPVSGPPADTDAQAGAPLWSGQAPGEVYAVGEVRGFEYVQAGRVIGRSFGRYEGAVEREGRKLFRFSTKLERVEDPSAPGGLDPEQLRGQGELLLDAEGHVVEAWERSEAAELRLRVVDGELRAEAITGVPRDETWSHPIEADAGAMGYMSAFFEELMLATRELRAGDASWPLISLSTGSVDRWEARVSRQVDGEGLDLRTGLGERVRFVEGRLAFVEVPDIQLEVRPIAQPSWPSWEIAAPKKLSYLPPADADFEVRATELAGRPGEPRLAGEVLVPRGASEAAPVPAVVLLSGSAASDRHGFAGPPAIDLGYHSWGDALASAGFAVLRFDDRGVGESAFGPVSWRGEVEDARRALRTLLVQPEVDPDRILVIGHGEGGWRALILAAEHPREVAGVAMVGSPGRSYRRIIGASQPEVLKALEKGESLPSVLEANRDWYREILELELEPLLRRVQDPLWLVFGDEDFEFDADVESEAWRELAKSTRRELEVKRFEGLDHLLMAASGEATQTSYQKARGVDPGFVSALVDWARARTQPK